MFLLCYIMPSHQPRPVYLAAHVDEANINEYGRFDDVINSVDMDTAAEYFSRQAGKKLSRLKIRMAIDRLLRQYVLHQNLPADLRETASELEENQFGGAASVPDAQVEKEIDYIIMLIDDYRTKQGQGDNVGAKESREMIERSVETSPTLRSKRDLIEEFLCSEEGAGVPGDTDQRWEMFIANRRDRELIELIEAEQLNTDQAYSLVEEALRTGVLQTSGTAMTKLLPTAPRPGNQTDRDEARSRVREKLSAFVDRFSAL